MNEIRESDVFAEWLSKLNDRIAKARILARLKSARFGNLGDVRSVGDRVTEMRIDVGPGYRIYFIRRHGVIVILCAGDKSSQERDIARARAMAAGDDWEDA